jgi:hypothetical protein
MDPASIYTYIHTTHGRPCLCVGEQHRIGVHIALRTSVLAIIWYRMIGVVCLALSSTYLVCSPKDVYIYFCKPYLLLTFPS